MIVLVVLVLELIGYVKRGRFHRFESIDDIVYDDLMEGAKECQQLSNLMGDDG